VAPPAEGALAKKPAPLRELPGARRKDKEKTWRDEVNERVRSRRKKREETAALPLFDRVAGDAGSGPAPAPGEASGALSPREPAGTAVDPVIERVAEEPVGDLPLRHAVLVDDLDELPDEDDRPKAAAADRAAPSAPESGPRPEGSVRREGGPGPGRERPSVPLETGGGGADDDEWRLELEPPTPVARPVERPAFVAERARAAGIDLLFLSFLGLVVVYFASRAARVPVAGLLPAWPWLLSYLAFLGLAYATYFTGTTGQTLGKMVCELRVVDTGGQPPGYVRALLRAGLGGLGVAVAGLGLVPMALDPARRALHDRALRTRVIRG
jgi:uncharacterized RDD family membrane protein YckC